MKIRGVEIDVENGQIIVQLLNDGQVVKLLFETGERKATLQAINHDVDGYVELSFIEDARQRGRHAIGRYTGYEAAP